MKQKDKIILKLKEGASITPTDALAEFGCFRLAARIFDLRQDGHDIRATTIERNGKEFASYKLVQAHD